MLRKWVRTETLIIPIIIIEVKQAQSFSSAVFGATAAVLVCGLGLASTSRRPRTAPLVGAFATNLFKRGIIKGEPSPLMYQSNKIIRVACAIPLLIVGGNWNNGDNAGLWNWNGNNDATNTNGNIGGRI